MDYKLKVTYAADRDLRGIVRYLMEELQAPDAAAHFLRQVETCYAHIRVYPKMYALCENAVSKTDGLRKAVIGNYVLIYQTDDKQKQTTVLRLFYGRQDYYKDI